jgi:AAT family amino acid transporter
MDTYQIERRFKNPLVSGTIAVLFVTLFASVFWPVWGLIAKAIISKLAATGLAVCDPQAASQYIKDATEGSFFWMSINAWIWFTLIFSNYGKYSKTQLQPAAGIRYSLLAFLAGIFGFILLVGFIGIWWKPFNLGIMFMPKTAEEVSLATEGWAASNFYAVPVLICQIAYITLFGKWPFEKAGAPWDSFGVMMTSTVAALIVWFAMFVPSFLKFQLAGEQIVSQPMGSFPSLLAWCQCFIVWFLFPVINAEGYPAKLFAKTQPARGFVGFGIAFVMAFIMRGALRLLLAPMNLLNGAPIDLAVTSHVLSIITVALTWHHQFYDYPSKEMVKGEVARVLTRLAIVFTLGTVFGLFWMKAYVYFPFGGNDLGLGYPTLGLIGGQFVFLMPILFLNTFFDKWPLVKITFKKDSKETKKMA